MRVLRLKRSWIPNILAKWKANGRRLSRPIANPTFPIFWICLTNLFSLSTPNNDCVAKSNSSRPSTPQSSRWYPINACSFIDVYFSFIQSPMSNFEIFLVPLPSRESNSFPCVPCRHCILDKEKHVNFCYFLYRAFLFGIDATPDNFEPPTQNQRLST